MATPLKVEDLPLLQMTLTTKEILQLCRPWLDYQQNMLLFEKQLMLPIREEAIRARREHVSSLARWETYLGDNTQLPLLPFEETAEAAAPVLNRTVPEILLEFFDALCANRAIYSSDDL